MQAHDTGGRNRAGALVTFDHPGESRMASTMKPHTVDHVLGTLSWLQLLAAIAHVQRRQAHDAVVLGLLQARLASLTSGNGHAHRDRDELLTVTEAAKRLKLSKARVFELVRQKQIPKVAGLGNAGAHPSERADKHPRARTTGVCLRTDWKMGPIQATPQPYRPGV